MNLFAQYNRKEETKFKISQIPFPPAIVFLYNLTALTKVRVPSKRKDLTTAAGSAYTTTAATATASFTSTTASTAAGRPRR